MIRFIIVVSVLTIVSARAAGTNDNRPALTLQQAEQSALQKHPRVTASEFRALAAKQVTKEVQAALFPALALNATAVGTADDNTRIGAGGLNNPAIFERGAAGLMISQLITDFGRTSHLTKSAKLRARAEQENAFATRAEILLEVDAAYVAALQAQSVLRVAEQTVGMRQLMLNQVSTLSSNKMRSELDVRFARVSLEEGRLLLVKSQSDLKAAFAGLAVLLSEPPSTVFQLADVPPPVPPATNVTELISEALRNRPDLEQFRLQRDAALQFSEAEKRLWLPTLSAIGSAGVIPFHDDRLRDNYAAAGVNLNFPVFTGGLYSARRSEAEFRARSAEATLQDAEQNAVREVEVAWLNANTTLERVQITRDLLENASRALDLAQARLQVGSSSIVELSQAQLNQTSAAIAEANAVYDYDLQRAVLDFRLGRLR